MRKGVRGHAERARIYKLCSLALQYPDRELLAGRQDLSAAVAALRRSAAADALDRFFAWWSGTAAIELARHYVQTFDLHKRSALYLTFYSLGDRRDRGLGQLRLKKLYRAAGLPLEGSELPDYLPVMLDYAAASADGTAVLREHRVPLELLRAALHENGSAYAAVVDALCDLLSPLTQEQRAQVQRIAAEGPPMETVGLEPFAPPDVMPAMPGELRR